ncbi:MAG: CDP-diacylglycerol--serine O-phosphatidyltransferase [Clostridia bacterium]|nr:CDP-diacylglycerol--serine O-phosphatidyltransferase [Clostridia bacterium]
MEKIKSTIPNILTLLNMSLGVIAILLATNSSNDINLLFTASLLVMIAALTDRFDGKVARMLGKTSELGKELDSLADLISFGVAPIIITWRISFMHLGIPGYILALIFPMAGAYRLARFNVTTFDNFFIGMPITIAGAFLSIANLFNWFAYVNNKITSIHSIVTAAFTVLLSYFMICRIKIKKR